MVSVQRRLAIINLSSHLCPRTELAMSFDPMNRVTSSKSGNGLRVLVLSTVLMNLLVVSTSCNRLRIRHDATLSQDPDVDQDANSAQTSDSLLLPNQLERFPFLAAPTLDDWPTETIWPPSELPQSKISNYPLVAVAVYDHSPVYVFRNRRFKMVGWVRYGATLPAKPAIKEKKPGCLEGKWHEIVGGSYACTADGFSVGKSVKAFRPRIAPPNIDNIEPFLFGKVNSPCPRYHRIPTLEEEQAFAQLAPQQAVRLDYVDQYLDGIHFTSIVEEVRDQQRVFYRTSMGKYIRKDKVDILEQSGMHGELLQSHTDLPIAFVYGEAREVFALQGDRLRLLGQIEKHARFPVAGSYWHQDKEYVVGPQQIAVLRQDVRVATWHAKPDGLGSDAKWIHINLSQQTLVAYEGTRPVLASLVSSGIQGRDTPTGLYQINRKFITKTMRGPDDEHGWYEVGEVPWTFYYRGNFAIHGAYWHNVFGETRSHGCTNLPPADARWLFVWLDPQLPNGWHAQFQRDHGWAYFTETQVEIRRYQPMDLLYSTWEKLGTTRDDSQPSDNTRSNNPFFDEPKDP